ncbi:MAG: HNH endonuclease signature motif containing protein [Cyanobacteriota bacterium]|nr:HNH endonuclease signature motif containing protein [Cyanobacteriota bacterium]
MHAQRFRRYGDPLYVTPESKRRATNRSAQLARFEPKAVKPTTYRKCYGRHEHRVVAEQILGRPLRRGEIVHHKDGDKHNNDPSNLEVMTQSDHVREHFFRDKQIQWNGERLFPAEWAERFELSRHQFHNRYRAGWSMDRIRDTPVRRWSRAND